MRSLAALALVLFVPLSQDDERGAPDFTLPDLSGKPFRLSSVKGKKTVALIFAGIECPRSTGLEPRIAALSRKYGDDVLFRVINSNAGDTVDAIAEHVRQSGFATPVLKDPQNRVADLYKIEIQPTVVLVDQESRIRYRGLFDDHRTEELVKNPYLRLAIDAVLAGKEPETPATQALGCAIERERAIAKSGDVTFAKHVSRILNNHCIVCHRQGQNAPISLETFVKARAWSYEIANTAKKRMMPPWKASGTRGAFCNERKLTDEEIAVLEKWHAGGAPEGDPKDLPEPRKFSDEWALGKPDLVLQAQGGFELEPRGRDEYRCYVLRNPFEEDKWIAGVEYRPGISRAVYHLSGYLDLAGGSERKDADDPQPGYRTEGAGPGFFPSGSLGGWTPGYPVRLLPDGTARLWRRGERLVIDTHYHKTGRREKDEGAQVAIYFAKAPVKRQLYTHLIVNPLIHIPAGAEDYRLSGLWTVPQDLLAYDITPHMHLLGQSLSVVATFPDGTTRDLVVIKDWDFGWQETYQFGEPIRLSRGTRVRLEGRYDNTSNNPNNPSHPPKAVTWGERTTDEMCLAYLTYTIDQQDLTGPKPPGK